MAWCCSTELGAHWKQTHVSALANSEITVGYRHTTWVYDGTFDITTRVEITDTQDNRVAVDQYRDEQILDGNGPTDREGSMVFQADRARGASLATVVIRDDVTGKVSVPETGRFDLTEPEPTLEVIREVRYTDEYRSGVQHREERPQGDARVC